MNEEDTENVAQFLLSTFGDKLLNVLFTLYELSTILLSGRLYF